MIKYISIKQILDNLLDNPLLQGLSLERVVNYAVRFIQKVGMPSIFEEKVQKVQIQEYRGLLPCDLCEIIQVRAIKQNCNNTDQVVLRYSTDSFHMSSNKTQDNDLTYKVQGGCIFTSFKEGDIEVSYRAFLVDEEGYPLIPENGSFEEALELFIKKNYYNTLFELGKINGQVLKNVQQQYAWAVGQASSDLVRPSLDQLQTITNSWCTLIQRTNEHSLGFKNNGTMEKIKLQ